MSADKVKITEKKEDKKAMVGQLLLVVGWAQELAKMMQAEGMASGAKPLETFNCWDNDPQSARKVPCAKKSNFYQ